ncbi:MAG: hypothetical protein V3V49_00420, partial [Candidatus Krumholzibacteria bacterium]
MRHRTHIGICAAISTVVIGLASPRASADVVFEQVETATTLAFTSLDITKPSGTVEDELLIAIVASEKNNAIISPAGWTVIDDGVDGDKGNARTTVVYKVAGPSEPAVFTFTSSAAKKAVGAILRYSGNDPTTPIDVSAAVAGSSINPTAPSVTTTIDGALILRLFGAKKAPDGTNPFPPGTVGRFAIEVAGKVGGGAADAAQASAGASGTAAFLLAASGGWRAVTVAIVPGGCSIDADCDDGNGCTSDICNAGTCENNSINEGLACDDGDACLVGETCQTGICTGGTTPDCSGTGDQCNADNTCDPAGAEGNCDTPGGAINEGLACDDLDACNIGETCQTGLCTGGAPPDCS